MLDGLDPVDSPLMLPRVDRPRNPMGGGGACEYGTYELGGETSGDPTYDAGADLEMASGSGGGIIIIEEAPVAAVDGWSTGMAGLATTVAGSCDLWFLLELGLLWIRECRVSSSDRLKRLVHPGKWQACGFSPVCVRTCLV